MLVNEDYSDRVIKKRTELMPKLKEARRKNQRAFLRFDKLVIYDNPVNSGSTNGEENPVTPINMTCYLYNESLGPSLYRPVGWRGSEGFPLPLPYRRK